MGEDVKPSSARSTRCGNLRELGLSNRRSGMSALDIMKCDNNVFIWGESGRLLGHATCQGRLHQYVTKKLVYDVDVL